VITFGAPQVVIPPGPEHAAADLWKRLDSKTFNFVNSFDPIPRSAGKYCEDWTAVISDAIRNAQLAYVGSVITDAASVEEKIKKLAPALMPALNATLKVSSPYSSVRTDLYTC
jgi:hypothetical protein